MRQEDREILHRIDKRLVAVETMVSDLPEIRRAITALKVRVAGFASIFGLLAGFIARLFGG